MAKKKTSTGKVIAVGGVAILALFLLTKCACAECPPCGTIDLTSVEII